MAAGKPLTATFVKNVTKPGKYFDNSRYGLFLRIDKDGRKYWIQRIVISGKRREIGLGGYPLVTLSMAREQAAENKRKAYLGGDPLAEKRKARMATDFASVVEKYLEAKLAEFRSEKHKKQWRATLDTYAIPVIGHMPVETIDVTDVVSVLKPIWEEKTETASRLRGRIEKVLSWATVNELRTGDNPARWKGNLSEVLPKPSKVATVKHHPALAQSDTGRWWADLASRDGMSIKALQFAALTASRSGEIRGMTWDEVDFEAGHWTIPAARMKARRQHRVPLTPTMIALLKELPRLEGSPYVFFGAKGGMLSDMALSSVMRKMHQADLAKGGPGYVDAKSGAPAVPHGLRSTFRDWAAEEGYDHHMAELALAHNVDSMVVRAYRRTDALERRRKMMVAWEKFLKKE
ncbi:tyrosine-type recombinase/integrase [Ruegeria arenilitoris]|uniref:Prophage CP4-57 integrase n=1 Tax=Ruegeria arenilitoris TaxID=1173585 RepID=A0A238JXB0_9RHOB|nr:site-specific integrase [Ruegeria arenilitoris]SMX34482.1 Prophage CP4-57 integrase [Ruegeria arenilitoris]